MIINRKYIDFWHAAREIDIPLDTLPPGVCIDDVTPDLLATMAYALYKVGSQLPTGTEFVRAYDESDGSTIIVVKFSDPEDSDIPELHFRIEYTENTEGINAEGIKLKWVRYPCEPELTKG
jgi:hypothetical protein